MKNVTFLDCTLRDGGYYNDWDFDLPLAEKIIDSLNYTDVNIVEVGYKSDKNDRFYGLFRYCNENYLQFLKKYSNSEYAFMIDVKEFIKDGNIDEKKLDELILDANDSVFSWVRLASHFKTVDQLIDLSNYFKNKNYKIAINLMGASLLQESQFIEALQIAEKCNVEVFYLADSFGSFYPEDIKTLVRFCRKYYKGSLGFHAHDNQGLAFYNAIAAIEEGVEFIDATILGMGRGAGNLKTEQFLLGKYKFLNNQEPKRFGKLLDLIESDIEPLKQKYNWGYSYSYMISGLNNIHQAYCQELQDLNRFSVDEIGEILQSIPKQNKSSFNSDVLDETINNYLNGRYNEDAILLPKYQGSIQGKDVIIIAGGPTSKKYQKEILQLVERGDFHLFEINKTGILDGVKERTTVVLNNYKLEKYLRTQDSFPKAIVTGQQSIPSNAKEVKIYSQEYKIGDPEFNNHVIHIPDYDAGIYGIMLVLLGKPKSIALVGFDGTKSQDHKLVMESFFSWMNSFGKNNSIEINSLTPTTYEELNVKSIYSL